MVFSSECLEKGVRDTHIEGMRAKGERAGGGRSIERFGKSCVELYVMCVMGWRLRTSGEF